MSEVWGTFLQMELEIFYGQWWDTQADTYPSCNTTKEVFGWCQINLAARHNPKQSHRNRLWRKKNRKYWEWWDGHHRVLILNLSEETEESLQKI